MMTTSEEIKFILSIEEIKRIFEAGIRRGNDEATSYDCGDQLIGDKYEDLVDVVIDIVNHGIPYVHPSYTKIDVVESWFKGE